MLNTILLADPLARESNQEREFVPNDLFLSPLSNTQLVFGPNCAGKSTFLRQIGISCVLAQIGSYVPAVV